MSKMTEDEKRLLKKSMIGDGETKHETSRIEVPASEKLEIISLVEQSHLPARRPDHHQRAGDLINLGLGKPKRSFSLGRG